MFNVAVPPEHRTSLAGRLRREILRRLNWKEGGDVHVLIGCEGTGELAHCMTWPGLEAAESLILTGFARFQDHMAMRRLHEVGQALGMEQNLDRLLELILSKGRELLSAEAGSIYVVVGEPDRRELLFAHTQNDRLSLPYHRIRMPISTRTIAGYVATSGQTLNLEDVYQIPTEAPYSFNDAFDKSAGYRTTSMLVVPLKDPEGEILGVLQFINCLEPEQDGSTHVAPFPEEQAALAQSLAAQAAIALKNVQLRQDIERLFESFVTASVLAIEQRDPTTSGHSARVADLTVGLAEAINATPNGKYGVWYFNEQQLLEIRYASLLHDFGKVGVREQVLVKAKKLDATRLEIILQRLRQREMEETLQLLYRLWKGEMSMSHAEWERRTQERKIETDKLIQIILQSNEPTVLPQEVARSLDTLSDLWYQHWNGGNRPVVESPDLAALQIPKGSLSTREREEIESHVTHTFQFLRQIPWTRPLSRVPEIAYAHHERLSGRGYPRRLGSDEIPVQSRAMAISDVFDALTASDRPYKASLPVERSLDILGQEAKQGDLDSDLLELFIQARVFDRILKSQDGA